MIYNYQKYFKTQYIDFESLVVTPNILLNLYLKLSADVFDMIFQSQGFDKLQNLRFFPAINKFLSKSPEWTVFSDFKGITQIFGKVF